MKTEEIAELLPHMTAEERAEVFSILAQDKAVWRPLPGPQLAAYHCDADVLGYGGAAGGGKTDLMCGAMLTQHKRGIIFRRESTQLVGIIDRLTELIGGRDGYNGQDKIWRLPDRQIEFGSVPNLGDETKYQGRPHDFIGFDEAANFLESQVRFLLGWMRTTQQGQRCRAILTFNPPTTTEGRWVVSYFAPWLDDKHPNPAMPGELRWFATVDGKDTEVPSGERFVLEDGERVYEFDAKRYRPDKIIQPLSRSFIPSSVGDNPYLTGTGYMAQLQSLPEPLRSQMLNGDFKAGMEDDAYQVIPTAWVDAAMDRWSQRNDKGTMTSMGVDVARGGRDETIISRRHGSWFDDLICKAGASTPDGPTVATETIVYRRDQAPVHIDVVGWGSSPYDFLNTNGVHAVPVNGANKSEARTKDGRMKFVNKRAEIWWKMREALDPNARDPVALPDDTALRADLCAPKWKLLSGGIIIESKEDLIKRLGRSPDRGDAVCMANMITVPRDFWDDEEFDRNDASRSSITGY